MAIYNECTQRSARRQRGSGAQWFRPGDVLTPEFLIECKEYGQFVIQRLWLEKAIEDARAYHRVPVLAFGYKPTTHIWGVVRQKDVPASLPTNSLTVFPGARTQITISVAHVLSAGAMATFKFHFTEHDEQYVAMPIRTLFYLSDCFLA